MTNVFYKPLQALYDLLNEKVPDINSTRRQLSGNAKQWIFPDKPSGKDQYFPKLAIKHESIRIEELGADRFLMLENSTDVNGVYVYVPVTIYCFVKRNDLHSIEDFEGKTVPAKNKKQADWLADRVFTELMKKSSYNYFAEKQMSLKVTGLQPAYRDSEYLYAAEVSIEIKLLKTFSTVHDNLINNIDYTFTVNYNL